MLTLSYYNLIILNVNSEFLNNFLHIYGSLRAKKVFIILSIFFYLLYPSLIYNIDPTCYIINKLCKRQLLSSSFINFLYLDNIKIEIKSLLFF